MALYVCESINEDFSVIINKFFATKYPISKVYLTKWQIPKILSHFFLEDLMLQLWVVKLLKLNIEKSWFDYHETRCCNLAMQHVLPKLLPGPNLHFCFMKNSVHTSPLWSLAELISCWNIEFLKFTLGLTGNSLKS